MSLRIAFLGDTLLGGEAQPTLERHGYAYALDGLRPLLQTSDLVVANLEGPVTSVAARTSKVVERRKRYWYRALPESIHALKDVGVQVVSLANNHVLDYGPSGLAETIATLETTGIAYCGAGRDGAQARRPVILQMRGMRIGFLSYLQSYALYRDEDVYAADAQGGCARLRLSAARADLAALAGEVDLRIVLVHWGRNYRDVMPRQERLAAGLRAAGADLVIGHHPHIVQRVDLTDGKPVLFSLGNGPFGTIGRFREQQMRRRSLAPYGLVPIIEIGRSTRIRKIELNLIEVDNRAVGFRPVQVPAVEAGRMLARFVDPAQGWQRSRDGVHVNVDPTR